MIPPHTKAIPQTRNPSGVPQAPEGFLVVSLFLKGAQLCRKHRQHHLGVHLCAQPLQGSVCQTYRLPRLCALHRGAGAAAQSRRCHSAEIGQQGGGSRFILFVGGKQHRGGVAIAGGSGAGTLQPQAGGCSVSSKGIIHGMNAYRGDGYTELIGFTVHVIHQGKAGTLPYGMNIEGAHIGVAGADAEPPRAQAARDLGANSVTVFRKVILPLSLPGVLSGITMVFVPSVSTFAISRMLGGGTELLLGDLIERQFLGGAYNPQLGAAISLVMMVIVVICMLVMNRFGEGEEQAVML